MLEQDAATGLSRWGLLGPHSVVSERRTRTLGLSTAVRAFNDAAVPGLGGIWFAMPLVLATLGISVAARVRRPNIEVANAIEALGCRLGFGDEWRRDARLRGLRKLRALPNLSYSVLRQVRYYVTQPMRQQTVQPLLALGLVESSGERFNAYVLSDAGKELIKLAFGDSRAYNRPLEDLLADWATKKRGELGQTPKIGEAISPLRKLNASTRRFLEDRLIAGGQEPALRRRAAIQWVRSVSPNSSRNLSWGQKPAAIRSDAHWQDLRTGAKFFQARDAAVATLDSLEALIAASSKQSFDLTAPIPKPIRTNLKVLRQKAEVFLSEKVDPSPGRTASLFFSECRHFSDRDLLKMLADRDRRGVFPSGEVILPGPAFEGRSASTKVSEDSPDADGNEAVVSNDIQWPEGISYRLNNLFLLTKDLDGQLDRILRAGRS